MKRFSLAGLGFVWGLLVTWASVYMFSHLHWPEPQSHVSGCNDMEHCGSHVAMVSGLLTFLLCPAVAFAALNAYAFRRWSRRKWGTAFGIGTLLVILFYFASYAVPRFGLVG